MVCPIEPTPAFVSVALANLFAVRYTIPKMHNNSYYVFHISAFKQWSSLVHGRHVNMQVDQSSEGGNRRARRPRRIPQPAPSLVEWLVRGVSVRSHPFQSNLSVGPQFCADDLPAHPAPVQLRQHPVQLVFPRVLLANHQDHHGPRRNARGGYGLPRLALRRHRDPHCQHYTPVHLSSISRGPIYPR